MKNYKKGILYGVLTPISALGGAYAFMKRKKNKKMDEDSEKKEEYSDMPSNVALADSSYRDKFKRCLDLAICIPATVVAALPMVLVGIAIE